MKLYSNNNNINNINRFILKKNLESTVTKPYCL